MNLFYSKIILPVKIDSFLYRLYELLSILPCHDPCPEFLQPAVTLPGIVFKMETIMQASLKMDRR